MHVLIVPSYYPNTYNPIDGIYFKVQAEALAEKGLKVGVVAPVIIKHYILFRQKKIDYGYKNPPHRIPTFIYQIPSFPLIKKMNEVMRLYFGKKVFKKYVEKYGLPDLVHLHSFENGVLTQWIKNKYKINYIVTEHSTRFWRNEYSKRLLRIAKKTFKNATKVTAVSHALKEKIAELSDAKIEVLPNFIDTSFFCPSNKSKNYDFISVGGLRDVKNYSLLIKAFNEINGRKDYKLAIIGEGPLREDLEILVTRLGQSENIDFLGQLAQEEVRDLYNSSKIFVSSSKYETFGVAIIEAMSCGLPAVCTKSGGPESFITKRGLGTLCDHSILALSSAMQNQINSISQFENKIIREHIINHYSNQAVTKILKVLYVITSKEV